MTTQALLVFLGEEHIDRRSLPEDLASWVEDALSSGAVFMDCRGRLVSVVCD